MDEIPISKFKATCLAVVERVRKTRKPIRLTKFGEPVADVVAIPPAKKPGDWIGSFAGTGRIVGDIVSPASDEDEWEALR